MAWAAQDKIHQISLAYRGPSTLHDVLNSPVEFSDEDDLDEDISYEDRQTCKRLLSKKREREKRTKENTQSELSERLQESLRNIDEWLIQHGSFFNALTDTEMTYLLKKLYEKAEPSDWEYFPDYSSRVPNITQFWKNVFTGKNVILYDYDNKEVITMDKVENDHPYVFFRVHSHEGRRYVLFTKEVSKIEDIRNFSIEKKCLER